MTASTEPSRRRLGIVSWCLYDGANSAFNTVIGTFIFSVYFTRAVAESETAGTTQWGYALAIAGVIIALTSPILGAIADRAGRRKPWIAGFSALCIAATAAMWYVEPAPDFVMLALVLLVIASIGFELSTVFYNAMLPHIAPSDRIGRYSGWGWASGYLGGLTCLVLALFGFVQGGETIFGLPEDNAENVRATALLVAAWFAVFALPLFFFTPDQPRRPIPLRQAAAEGLAMLYNTIRQIRRFANILKFLLASAIYRDGLSTLFAFGGIYAGATFGMSFEQIVIFAIALNVTAALGALSFAWIDDWIGPRNTILIALVCLILLGIPLLLVQTQFWFWILALGLGTFVGPLQAASRSFIAREAPTEMSTEMFGIYALTGKAIAFAGPFLLGLMTDIFNSQRAGMSVIVVFFAIGLSIMLTVRPASRIPVPEDR